MRGSPSTTPTRPPSWPTPTATEQERMSSMNETAASRPEGRDAAVRMRGISKSFDGVRVLTDVDFEVLRGEVHALAGGNGAGKSTLMKILQGVYSLDAGEIEVDGRPVRLSTIQDARAAGIGMVFQEFSLVPSLTVAQNIWLGVEPLGRTGLIRDREAVRRCPGGVLPTEGGNQTPARRWRPRTPDW